MSNWVRSVLAMAGLCGRDGRKLPANMSADELMKHGYEFIEEGDFDSAFVVGGRLKRMGFTGGFEIIARTYAAEREVEQAIRELEKGVQKAPHVWILWEMLGNYRSDREDFDQALQCYDRAVGLPDANLSSINLNRAICQVRNGKPELALPILDSVTDAEVAVERECVRMDALIELRQYEECLAVGDLLIRQIDKGDAKGKAMDQLSRTYAWMARAFLSGRGDCEKAKEVLDKSTRYDKTNGAALTVRRELDGVQSGDAKMFHLVVQGEWDQPLAASKHVPGFFANYHVLASSPEEALSYAQALEPEQVRKSMKVSRTKVGKREDWQTLKGVYWCLGGYTFFSEDSGQ
jgi:tetratricopeptide (TPR) repeat protein